jgi:hypothetical protein
LIDLPWPPKRPFKIDLPEIAKDGIIEQPIAPNGQLSR